jgi:hypothetical protein
MEEPKYKINQIVYKYDWYKEKVNRVQILNINTYTSGIYKKVKHHEYLVKEIISDTANWVDENKLALIPD